MLKVLAVAFSLSVLALGALAQNNGVTGRWTTALDRGGKSITFKMDLKAFDNSVTGTMDITPNTTVEIQNGRSSEIRLLSMSRPLSTATRKPSILLGMSVTTRSRFETNPEASRAEH